MHSFLSHLTLVCFLAFAILAHFEGSESNAAPVPEPGPVVADVYDATGGKTADPDKPCSCEQHGNKMTSLTCGVVLALLDGNSKSNLVAKDRRNFEWFNNIGARLFATPPKKPPRFTI